MLKILANVNNRQTLFLGLDRENTTRLHEGKPIPVDVQALGQSMAGKAEPVQDVILLAGETIEEMHTELSRHMKLPPLPRD